MNINVKKGLTSVFILFICLKLSISLSFFSSIYTAYIWKSLSPEKSLNIYNIIFYSYPLVLGILFTFYSPRLFGWFPEKTRQSWKLFILYSLIIVIALLNYPVQGTESPYHGMSWQVFILAPIGEELIFRGGFFIGIYYLLKLNYEEDSLKVALLTIVFSAVSFGVWHIQNIMVDPDYTGFQIIHTSVIGLMLGHLRYKTGSIYYGIVIHAMINLLATLN